MVLEKNMGENSKASINPDEGLRHSAPNSIQEILRKVSSISDSCKKSCELDLHICSYADELRKVELFEREIPLCVHLLQQGIVRLEEEKLKCQVEKIDSKGGTVVKIMSMEDKKTWMSSAQLWTAPVEYETDIDSLLPLNGVRTRAYKKAWQMPQMEKKSRRYWDLDLHQKFVDALNSLGGPFGD